MAFVLTVGCLQVHNLFTWYFPQVNVFFTFTAGMEEDQLLTICMFVTPAK